MHKIIRLPEVINTTGLSRSTIYERVAKNTFPRQVSLGSKSVGWQEAEVQEWIGQRISKSHTKTFKE